MINNKLKILTIRDLLKEKLTIPIYQRPYRWTTESALTLFNDIYSSFEENIPEYRIGSVVLHLEKDKFNIVDGQQRITTISILVYCFYQVSGNDVYNNLSTLLVEPNIYNELSSESIIKNHEILLNKCKDIDKSKLDNFIDFVMNKCTFVKIITENEQEAFQFFDSQNSRGKTLAPQDLLKSYHLREMKDEPENFILQIINNWENTNQKELENFFSNNLFPIVRWHKNYSGLYYSSRKISIFKGIKRNNNFNFSIYHKAANLYVEHYNDEGMFELSGNVHINQFQLSQPIISGRRFFQYTLYYNNLLQKIKDIITSYYEEKYIPNNGSGNKYVRNLFFNIVLFFVDKFNIEELTENRIKFLYKWSYSLRLVMHAVYLETINNYALGKHERINNGMNMFSIIADMQNPLELDAIILENITKENLINYKSTASMNIWNYIYGVNN